ncbi:Enoyl-CoA hydratase/carnithine racemase OS=Bosea thiooxidans OX=53254 GN=SAMN05660750_03140 PE=3 SV=1 [Bosea thiooxidans]|uniref:Enoyl-CoA hydratase/carnithine racemase n=1 Tax=Bosea thiooxidans TaxID=53254 RepID=A0A1T5FCS1_9HYPH|nr:enoyl-CoA hydratase/isomerase family protein [Bosea thiooxidans]SKB93973.1 Enoyl-CoA hydratase/carnithine racemase [Bosea thiooxidans]
MNDEILYTVEDGIGTITLNRPQARNALTFAMYERIAEICRDPAAHGDPRVIVMTGAGDKAFAAGTDIAQFRAFESAEDALAYEERIEKVMGAIERCPVPTLAAISGAVTGGGAGIALACDLRIATVTARFGFPIARTLGNCLSMENYARLYAMLGPARVKDIVFTARLVEAEEGRQIGLYGELLPDHAALMQRAGELARTIAGHAPLTMRATKEAMRRLTAATAEGLDGRDLVTLCYTSADFREGMEAFLGKRTPNWTGR